MRGENGNGPAPCKVAYACPVCGSNKADYAPRPGGGWWVGCWRCEANGLSGGDYLRELVGYTDAPHAPALLEDPPCWLGHLALGPSGPSGGTPPPLPPRAWFARCAVVLRKRRAGAEAREYLASERGVRRDVLWRAGVGWDPATGRLVFPFTRDGEIVAYKTRALDGQMVACPGRGRPWPLYPRVPRGRWALLVAGELDALCGLSHGLPAVSVPLGAGKWRDEWAEDLRGKRVTLCFDHGEHVQTHARFDDLRSAGIDVRLCDWFRLGMPFRYGSDLSNYLNAGGDPDRLRRRGWGA